MATITPTDAFPTAMQTELTPLVDALSEVAYDAGCALLFPVDAPTTQRYAARYNGLCRQLCRMIPCLESACPHLPEDATAGTIRITARAVAAYVQETATPCLHRIAA